MGKRDMYWVTFFSQTGSEIVNLSRALHKSPDFIITNNSSIENFEIYDMFSTKLYTLPNRPTVEDYTKLFNMLHIKPQNTIITLHGYLRILPQSLCVYRAYNLHPGLINIYPELKGLNPQTKATKLQHQQIGCVIHKVSNIVDNGKIILFDSCNNTYNLNNNYSVLKNMALQLWIRFFTIMIKNDLNIFKTNDLLFDSPENPHPKKVNFSIPSILA